MYDNSKCQKRERLPNVVLILTDDQGWGDLSLNGNVNLDTPNIDSLAHKGAIFEYFYVQPLCAPTRAELLTGRYYPRTGVRGVTRRAEYMNLDETTIAEVFKCAGYVTGCFGKWHSGSAYPYHPNGRGFDEFFGFCCGHWSHYFDSTLEHNGEEVRSEGYIIDSLTEKAMEFMQEHYKEPFFCYVPFNSPHSPFQVPDKWFNKFKDAKPKMRHSDPEKEDLDVTRSVLAMCENIDWNVGRLVQKITDLGLIDDTIFVYLSDNGPNGWRWNGGMSGKKGSTDEGGVRSPCSITWQGNIEAGLRIEQIAGAIDLLPTLADLANIDVNTKKTIDGKSLKPILLGNHVKWPERAIFAQSPNGKKTSIRTQQYRAGGESGGLYDISRDIGQCHDLSTDLPKIYGDLKQSILDWREEVLPKDITNRAIPIGYAQFPNTYLNAQDGNPSGDITWSSIHPNASYFINWKNINDSISWEIDVQTAGNYEITLMYACKEGDEGSEIHVEYKNSSVNTTITEPFNPPLKNDRDRVKRSESYEKEFKPLKLGVIFLEKGKGEIRLHAKTKVGDEVCEVRTLKVKLI